jgi:hypothetical protein
VTTTEQPATKARRTKRKGEPLPPYEGPEAVGPPLRWARRFTPLGIGRRRVRLSIDGGWLAVTRVPVVGGERVVVQAPLTEFHSVTPSRGGRGLHLWHGERLFRLTGKSTAKAEGGSSLTLGDDPVSAVIGLILLPFYLFALIGLYTAAVASQRENVATTVRWLGPVVGHAPPGLEVRPPLSGGWLSTARWTLRLAVVGAAVGALIAVQ